MSAALAHPAEDGPQAADAAPRIEAAAFVLSLRGRGISDLSLLRAMETVPREIFAPRRYADLARQDVALPLACGETMTAPGTVALMLAALAVRPGHRVLEIGTGSGYVTALLAQMGASVQSVERRFALAESAWYRLRSAGLAGRCDLDCRDGFRDDAETTRFDRILLNGAVPEIAPSLTSRLVAGGRLVAGVVGEGGAARLVCVSRDEDGRLVRSGGVSLRMSRLSGGGIPAGATEA